MNYGDIALLGPDGDRPVWCDVFSAPVELDNVLLYHACSEEFRLHLVRIFLKGVNGGRPRNLDTVMLVLLLALFGVGSRVPRMRRHEDFLFNGGLHFDDMSGAGLTAPWPASIGSGLIIEHQERIIVPVGRVITHNRRLAEAI